MAHKTKKEKRALRDCKQSVSNLVDQIRLEEKSARSIGINELRRQKKERRRKVRFEKGRLSSWLTLDNAGIIYPSLREENWDFVYRISAVLTTGVDPQLLQRAVDDLMPRFPSFFVRLKAGFFWNYFEGNNKRLLVEKEEDFPCARFKKGSDSHLIRVIYYKNRVSVECFHALADGTCQKQLDKVLAGNTAGIHCIIKGFTQYCLCFTQVYFLVCADHHS